MMKDEFCPAGRMEWRSWLRKNHSRKKEVWLIFYKKHTGKATLGYRDSVEEALCFGWIDGLKRRIDDGRYCHRFTPRKPASKWSPLNISLAEKLISEGKMTAVGLASFERRKSYDPEFLEARAQKESALDPEFERALKENSTAWRHFNELAPGYRKQYIDWLNSAKRPDTRVRRLAEVLKRLEQNMKPEM